MSLSISYFTNLVRNNNRMLRTSRVAAEASKTHFNKFRNEKKLFDCNFSATTKDLSFEVQERECNHLMSR